MNSKIHVGRGIVCPFCNSGFATVSGVSHHVESAACPQAPPGMNRQTLLRFLQTRDPRGFITNKQLEWHPEQNVEYSASQYAFNGRSWECYLCHKTYRTVASLNQHLNSPAHESKGYHCTNKARCGNEFVSLAALCNHLESESCGAMRFQQVGQKFPKLADAMMGRRMITGF